MEFVNRFHEMAALRELLEQRTPVLVRLYGRRRLGKTEMLRHLCETGGGLYLHLDEADPPQIRQSLSLQVAQQLHTMALPYRTWDDVFSHLAQLHPSFVVLDEFQRLLNADRQAVTRLQHQWDSTLRRSGPSLILCGSSVGMMQRLTTRRSAPLFGRLGGDLRLRPFGYAAVRLLYPTEPEAERVRRYAVFGGTPHYHSFSVGTTLPQAVSRAFLSLTSALIDEPQSLLRMELRGPARYNSILYEIGKGTHDLRGLESKVEVKKGGLSPYLAVLQDELDLLTKDDPVGGKERQARYRFGDPFFRFYYRFIFDSRPRVELGKGSAVWEGIQKELDGHIGRVFEEVVHQALTLLNGTDYKGIPIDFERIGRWWNRTGDEIDVVAEGKDTVLVGEVTWSARAMGVGTLRDLQRKAALIEHLGNRPVRFLLVARSGFDDHVVEEAARGGGCLLLTLEDLARVFDEGYARPGPAG